MSKIILTKKTSAIFLATVLVAGMIVISFPFSAYAQQQYQQDYSHNYQQDYDSSYYQSDPRMDDKSHSKQSQRANCDNNNVNVNGIEQKQSQRQLVDSTLAGSTDDAAIAGQELTPEEAFAALNGNGDPLINAERNILNVCFNDNENSLTGEFTGEQGQTGGSTPPVTEDPCVLCFSPHRTAIEAFLAGIVAPVVVIPGILTITADIDTVEELCDLFGTGLTLTVAQNVLLQTFLAVQVNLGLVNAINIIVCLITAGLITLVGI